MSRDVLIRGDVVLFLDRTPTDVTLIPPGASLISEADWKNLINGQDEAEYIASLGLKTE